MARLENFRLKVFRAVAENLSFRKAAEHLFLTQPAVTLQIKALEEDLGIRLFDRSGSKVSLTRQGSILFDYATKLANLAVEAESALGAAEGKVSGELAIGVSTTIAQYVLPRLLSGFLAENPHVQLSVHSGNTSDIVKALLAEKVSVGLIEGPARTRGVRTELLMDDELVLIAPQRFEFDHLTRSEFQNICFLLREEGSGSRQVVESALEKAGLKLKSFKSVMALDSTEAIKSAVEAGLGLAFVSRWAISKELELGLLKIADVEAVRIKRQFALIFRIGPEPHQAAAEFRAFALDRARLLSGQVGKRASAR